ncbi:hypothetical protein K469DRAFT_648257, partial [Zopfia rhizophila CBS 207.26]
MAIQTISRQKQRKAVKRSADFYGNLRKELAAQGPIQVEYSQATEVNMSGVWKRWNAYSQDVNQRPIDFLKSAVAGDYMAFFTWVLDRYPGVRKKSSVHQYWRQLKMLYKKYAGRLLDKDLVDDVNNYINVLKRQYKLETSVRDKPVLSVDDLLLVLHHHWVLDTWVYPDEEQRLLLALLFLFAAYTGSRPCSLVDASGQVLSSAKTAVPLRAHTAGRYMKRLGRDVGMEQPLSQSCIRRATGNAVDDVATVAERDQIMGHGYSGVFQFYINPRVKCDVQAAYLDQPSDKA